MEQIKITQKIQTTLASQVLADMHDPVVLSQRKNLICSQITATKFKRTEFEHKIDEKTNLHLDADVESDDLLGEVLDEIYNDKLYESPFDMFE